MGPLRRSRIGRKKSLRCWIISSIARQIRSAGGSTSEPEGSDFGASPPVPFPRIGFTGISPFGTKSSVRLADVGRALGTWLLTGWLMAGCASTPKVDWNSRVGIFTYDQVVAEMGPPDKSST